VPSAPKGKRAILPECAGAASVPGPTEPLATSRHRRRARARVARRGGRWTPC